MTSGYQTLRRLESSELEAAVRLVQIAWPNMAKAFGNELADLISRDEVTLMGAFDRGADVSTYGMLIGIGLLAPCQLDFYTWVLSWGVVHPKYQRQGVATHIAEALCAEAMALQSRRKSDDATLEDECIITVSTKVPNLFRKLGFESTLTFGRGKLRHHMIKSVRVAVGQLEAHR